VLGEYLNIMQGRVYESFDRERNVADGSFDPKFPLYWSLDFNVTPLCSVLAQKRDGKICVIDEICLDNATVDDAVNALHNRIQGAAAGLTVTGDASGRQRSVAALGMRMPSYEPAWAGPDSITSLSPFQRVIRR
jgi:hypothetical protein